MQRTDLERFKNFLSTLNRYGGPVMLRRDQAELLMSGGVQLNVTLDKSEVPSALAIVEDELRRA